MEEALVGGGKEFFLWGGRNSGGRSLSVPPSVSTLLDVCVCVCVCVCAEPRDRTRMTSPDDHEGKQVY